METQLKIFFVKNGNIFFEIMISLLRNNLLIKAKKLSNSTIDFKYENHFPLQYIQKVRYFRIYDSIEECIDDIFNGIDTGNNTIKEIDENTIILTIPLLNKKYNSISFPLKRQRYFIDIINIQNSMITKLKKENEDLKQKIDKEITINIKRNDNIRIYKFRLMDTLEFLIEKMKNDEKNIKEIIIIKYNSELLKDIKKTFDYYDIRDNSTIDFIDYDEKENFFIFCKNIKEKTITLLVNKYETIKSIKEKINIKRPIGQKRLEYCGKILKDDKTLQFYGIQKHSTLFLL